MQNTNKYSGIVRYGFIGLAATALVGAILVLTFPIAAPAQETADDSAPRAEATPAPTPIFMPTPKPTWFHFGPHDEGELSTDDKGNFILTVKHPVTSGLINLNLNVPVFHNGDRKYNLSYKETADGIIYDIAGTNKGKPTYAVTFPLAKNQSFKVTVPPGKAPVFSYDISKFDVSYHREGGVDVVMLSAKVGF